MVLEILENTWETYTAINPIIQRILVSTLILLMGLIAGKLVGKFVKRLLAQVEADKHIKNALNVGFSAEESVGNFVTYFIYFLAVIMALDSLGVTSAVLNMLAGIVILLLLVSVILAIKDFVPNAMAGVMMKMKDEYYEGSEIKIKNISGVIEEIGVLETRIKGEDGEYILVPNSVFTKHETFVRD